LESEQPNPNTNDETTATTNNNNNHLSQADQAALAGVTLPPRSKIVPSKIKRRVVKKGFYSDEDDDSTEEEVYAESLSGPPLPVSSAMRQRNVLGITTTTNTNTNTENSSFVPAALAANNNNNNSNFQDHHPPSNQQQLQQQQQQHLSLLAKMDETEDADLAEDHRLVLNAAMHLLKSRNAGVVLAVCSLQYYCGVSSIKVRAAMGKALVRIHRDRREIQYVVLSSIRALVSECPSAFSPFVSDFFVRALDPPFCRIIKLDI
jgi:hypothetical protein